MIPRLQIVAAAALFSTGGVFIKLTDLDAWQVAGGRSLVAALLFTFWFGVRPSTITWRSCVAGAVYAATMVGFVVANKLTTAANAIFLQYTAPLYVVVLAPLLLREHWRRYDGLVAFLLACGLVLFFVGSDPVHATAPKPALGNIVAAADGVFWALTLLSLRWLIADGSALGGALVVGNLMAAAVSLPFLFHATVAPIDIAVVCYLGAFQIVVAYLFMTAGIRAVATFEASMLLLLEPLMSAVLAWLVYGEYPGLWAAAGSLLILLATATKSALDHQAGASPPT